MDELKKEEIKIDLLIKECDAVGQGIRNILLSGERILGLGFAIVAAGAAYGIKGDVEEIMILLPIALFAISLYGINVFTGLMAKGGYKRHLEEKVNDILGENVLLGESFIAPTRHKSTVEIFLWIIYIGVLALSVAYSIWTAFRYECYPKVIGWTVVIVNVFLFTGTLISFYKMGRAFQNTYKLARSVSGLKTGVSP